MNDTNQIETKSVKGRIVKLSDEGWGFITSKEVKFTRIFFHWSSLTQETIKFTELKVGMEVEFIPQEVTPTETRPNQKGWRAIKINVLVKNLIKEDKK